MNHSQSKPKPALPIGKCPSDQVLIALMTGEVSVAEVDTLFDHISSCTRCESRIESIRPDELESDLKPVIQIIESDEDRDTDVTAQAETDWFKSEGPSELVVDPNPAQDDFAIPEQVGKYIIRYEIARGGFGVVCKAHDPVLERDVAIKIPRLDRFESHEMVEEFIKEARTAVKLEHKNIVRVFDAAATEDGLVFIAMQWIDGESLKSLDKQSLSVERICDLMSKICDAMHYAHQQGFIHRDLKPANILIDSAGEPFVTDFGLALHEDNLGGRRGEFAGTLAYMSPEQVRGEVDLIDARTDVWSLGVMLYELLAGKRPFRGTADEARTAILEKPPTSLRIYNDQVSEELEAACFSALEKQCEGRMCNCNLLAQRIGDWAVPSGHCTRRRVTIFATLVGLLAIASFSISMSMYSGIKEENSLENDINKGFVFLPREKPYDLLVREPDPLVEPPPSDQVVQPVIKNHSAERELFSIITTDKCFYSFGELPEQDSVLRIGIQKSGVVGVAGLFFGFRQTGEGTFLCHVLTLHTYTDGPGKPVARLERHRLRFMKEDGRLTYKKSHSMGPAIRLTHFGDGIMNLEVKISNQKITSIIWQGLEKKQLIMDLDHIEPEFLNCSGEFGLLNYYGTITFHYPKLFVSAESKND